MTGPKDRTLVLERIFNATPELVYRCWTEPKLMKQWFVPKPWTIASCELDVRPGGTCKTVMKNPEGQEFPNVGVYLDVVKNKRFVFTDAFVEAWIPSEKAFMTAEISLEALPGGKTKYVATVRHWSVEDTETHMKMGFHEGWGKCADQLAELLETL
jgi:uncharacterized protein YndB with AHSA1/START domain